MGLFGSQSTGLKFRRIPGAGVIVSKPARGSFDDFTEQQREREQAEGEVQRAKDYRESLKREREGVAAQLAHVRGLEPDERVERPYTPAHRWPPARRRAGELERRLAAVDAELQRVNREGD
jgi:hypothetical protein